LEPDDFPLVELYERVLTADADLGVHNVFTHEDSLGLTEERHDEDRFLPDEPGDGVCDLLLDRWKEGSLDTDSRHYPSAVLSRGVHAKIHEDIRTI